MLKKDEQIKVLKRNHEQLKEDLETTGILEISETNPLDCEKCDFIAKSETGLKVHMQAKHTKQMKVKCKTCEFTCESKELLETHNANPCQT